MSDVAKLVITKNWSAKVSIAAIDRIDTLAKKYGLLKTDIVTACILAMSDDDIVAAVTDQVRLVNSLPKGVRGLLRQMDKLDDAQRKLVLDALTSRD